MRQHIFHYDLLTFLYVGVNSVQGKSQNQTGHSDDTETKERVPGSWGRGGGIMVLEEDIKVDT